LLKHLNKANLRNNKKQTQLQTIGEARVDVRVVVS
jgi:hypothetical protein